MQSWSRHSEARGQGRSEPLLLTGHPGGCQGQSEGRGRKRAGAFSEVSRGKHSEAGPTRLPRRCGGFQWLWAPGLPRVVQSLPWVHALYRPQDLTSPPGSERRAQRGKADRKGRGEQTRPNRPGKEGLGWRHSWGLLCTLTIQSAPWASPDQPPTLLRQQGPAPTLLLQGQQVPRGLHGEAGPGAGSASRADSANVTGGSGRDNRGLFAKGRTGGGGGEG